MSNGNGFTTGLVVTGAAVEQYRFMLGTGASTSAITNQPLGVSQMSGDVGDDIPVQVDGVTYLEVNGNSSNIAINDVIMPLATGAGVGVKAAGATAIKAARALEAATTDGKVIKVLLLGAQEVVGS